MTDAITDIARSKKRRGPPARVRIDLPNSDFLEPRAAFADFIGVTDKTVQRMDVPTTYIGLVAYVPHNESLNILASRAKRRNQPAPKPRRTRRDRT
jgi:hypothetical protein